MNLRNMLRKGIHNFVYRFLIIEVLNIPLRYFLKFIMPILPIKIKSYRIIKRFPVIGRVFVKLENSQRLILYTNGKDYIAEKLFYDGIGGFEKETISLFMELLQYSNIFIDIGANIGIYSLIAAIENLQRKVYSFEPVPIVINHLAKNIQLNDIKNISIESVAVGDYDGEIILHIPESNDIPASASTLKGFRKILDEIAVPIIKLDTFCKKKDIEPDLIKIDTEATEHYVIKGAIEIINRCEPIIICEVLKGRTEEYLNDLFSNLGYKYFWISNKGLIQKEQIEGDGTWKNMNYLFMSENKMKTILKKLISTDRNFALPEMFRE